LPVVSPDHLLEQADRLAALPRSGAPRQADLRRAISDAYYAVFHAVMTEVADDLVGSTQRHTPRYALVYRSVDHASLRRICKDACKTSLPKPYSKYAPTGGFGDDLKALATALVDLQEKRYLADYDPLFRTSAADAALDVAKARTALARLKRANPTRRSVFLSLLVFPPRQA